MNDIEKLMKDDAKYLDGPENWLIRAYFYCSNGLGILNEFRNLFLGILAIYIALKWNNLWLAIGLFIISSVILTFVGYIVVHRVSKVREWIGMRFATHYGIRAFNYQEGIYNELVKLNQKIDENK